MIDMRKTVSYIGKKSLNVTLRLGKRALDVAPIFKEKLKAQVLANIRTTPQAVVRSEEVWIQQHTLDAIDLYKQKVEADGLSYRPLVSIIVPTYNTPKRFFEEMVESVLSQTYDNWELILVDDASPDNEVRDLIKERAEKDTRIKYKCLEKNHQIAGATNEGIKMAEGEFISLFDHDDILWPNALYEVVRSLNKNKKLNLIYTDEDKIDGGNRFAHKGLFFKPDWNPDLLRSVNYITHFTTIRKSVLDEFGYENSRYDGTQDWELFLRITRNIPDDTIYHVPTILYSWRVHDKSTAKRISVKPYVFEAQERALNDDLAARGIKNTVAVRNKKINYWTIKYGVDGDPLVSIVIPSKNLYSMVKKCVDSIYEKSTYKNIEVIIVDTGSSDKRVFNWYKQAQQKYHNFKVVSFVEDKFSYARSCNYGATYAKGDFLLMLNNDIEVLTPDWIEQMVGYAQRPEIGAVGVRLYYPDRVSIQHAGVGVGLGGCAANLFQFSKNTDPLSPYQSIMFECVRDISAVTAACTIFRTKVFNEVGGFKEKYRINYNDVDLCLRLMEAGYRNVYLPQVTLVHYESISRGLPNTKGHDGREFIEAQRMFKKDWNKYIKHDPALNPNYNKDTPFLGLKLKNNE